MTDVKSFAKNRKRIPFRVDDSGDVFEAAPAIPAEILAEFASRFSSLDGTDTSKSFQTIVEVLELVLLPDSFTRLRARMSDRENPVEIDQLNDLILWLLGEYGLRPTQPSSDSSAGPLSPGSGMSSMDAALGAESTYAASLVTSS